jgi:hypothetical protein
VLVLRDGDTVRASGRVVADDGGTWFEPPLPVPAFLYAPGRQPPPRLSLGVPAIGVDLGRLDRRWEKQGAVEGYATLAGTWRQERLWVGEQGRPIGWEGESVRGLGAADGRRRCGAAPAGSPCSRSTAHPQLPSGLILQ